MGWPFPPRRTFSGVRPTPLAGRRGRGRTPSTRQDAWGKKTKSCAHLLLFRLLKDELREDVADVDEFGVEELFPRRVFVQRNPARGHRLGVVASKTVEERRRRLSK